MEDQEHLGRPAADAADAHQLLDDRLVVHAVPRADVHGARWKWRPGRTGTRPCAPTGPRHGSAARRARARPGAAARRTGGRAATSLCQTPCADLVDTCCPTMERASVVNASPLLCSRASPNCGISFFITRSRLTRWRQASSQNSATSVGAAAVGCGRQCQPFTQVVPLRAVLERDAERGELVADRSARAKSRAFLACARASMRACDRVLGERGAGLQEGLRRLLQHAQRGAERPQQRRVGAASCGSGRWPARTARRARRRVEVVVHRVAERGRARRRSSRPSRRRVAPATASSAVYSRRSAVRASSRCASLKLNGLR